MTPWQRVLRELEEVETAHRTRGLRLQWFRGQADAHWELRPTLHRFLEATWAQMKQDGVPFSDADRLRAFWDICKSFYSRYRNVAWSLLSPEERHDPWAILFSMRHHGVPTQVLDWTRSFAFAVHFALDPRRECDAAVYVLAPEALNSASVGIDGIITPSSEHAVVEMTAFHPHWAGESLDRPSVTVAIAPNHSNARMVAQQSAMTVSGYSAAAMENQYGPEVVAKIVIPREAHDDAFRYLEHAGVRHFSIFPDLDGIARDIVADVQKESDCIREALAARQRPAGV